MFLDDLTAFTGHPIMVDGWGTKKDEAASSAGASSEAPVASDLPTNTAVETVADLHSLVYQATKRGFQQSSIITIKGKAELFRTKSTLINMHAYRHTFQAAAIYTPMHTRIVSISEDGCDLQMLVHGEEKGKKDTLSMTSLLSDGKLHKGKITKQLAGWTSCIDHMV